MIGKNIRQIGQIFLAQLGIWKNLQYLTMQAVLAISQEIIIAGFTSTVPFVADHEFQYTFISEKNHLLKLDCSYFHCL